jgi:uncharacterized protein (TIGR02284 family)
MLDYTAIKEVVAICRDAEQGFRGAANAAHTPALKALFDTLSIERGEFANELVKVGRSMNMEIPNPSGIGGTFHAGWIELTGALSGHDEHAILRQVLRGEEMSVNTYRKALAMSLADGVRQILQRQAAQVEKSYNQVLSLRDGTAHDPVAQSREAS